MALFDLFKKKKEVKEEPKTVEKKEEIKPAEPVTEEKEKSKVKTDVKPVSDAKKKPKAIKDNNPLSIYKVHDIETFNKLYEKYGLQPESKMLGSFKKYETDYEIFHDGTLYEHLDLAELILKKGYNPFKKVVNSSSSHLAFTHCLGGADLETIKYFYEKGLLKNTQKIRKAFNTLNSCALSEYSIENIKRYLEVIKYLYDKKLISFAEDAGEDRILKFCNINDINCDDLRIIAGVYSFVSEEDKEILKRTYFSYPLSKCWTGVDKLRLEDFAARHGLTKEYIDLQQKNFIDKVIADFSDTDKSRVYSEEKPYVINSEFVFLGECLSGNEKTYMSFGNSVKYVFFSGTGWDPDNYSNETYIFDELVLKNDDKNAYFYLPYKKKIGIKTVHVFGSKDRIPSELNSRENDIENVIFHENAKTEHLFIAKNNMVFFPRSAMGSNSVFCKKLFISKDTIIQKNPKQNIYAEDVYTDAVDEHDGDIAKYILKNNPRELIPGYIKDKYVIHYGYSLERFCKDNGIIINKDKNVVTSKPQIIAEKPEVKKEKKTETVNKTEANREELIKQYNDAVDDLMDVINKWQTGLEEAIKNDEEAAKKEKNVKKTSAVTQKKSANTVSSKKEVKQVQVAKQTVIDKDAITAEFEDEDNKAIYIKYRGSDIKSVIIPEDTKEILEAAFGNCKNLKTVYFNAKKCKVFRSWDSGSGSGITTTTNSVFGCSDGSTLSYIDYFGDKKVNDYEYPYWVEKSYLENFIIGDKVEKLDGNLIRNTNVKEIYIPASVKNIDRKFFFGTSIQNITVDSDSDYYEVKNNMLVEKKTGALLYILPQVKLPAFYDIPSYINHVTKYAFYAHKEVTNVKCAFECKVDEPLLKGIAPETEIFVTKRSPDKSKFGSSNKYPSCYICDGDKLIAIDGYPRPTEIPEGITEIADGALANMYPYIIRFPKTCKKIGKSVFGKFGDLLEVAHFDNENCIIPKGFKNYAPNKLKFYTFGTGENIKKMYFNRWVQHTLISFEPKGGYTIDLDYYVKTEKTKYQAFLLNYCAYRYFGYKDDSGIKDNISSGLLKALEEGCCKNEIIIGNEDIDWLISNGYLSDQKLVTKARAVVAANEAKIKK